MSLLPRFSSTRFSFGSLTNTHVAGFQFAPVPYFPGHDLFSPGWNALAFGVAAPDPGAAVPSPVDPDGSSSTVDHDSDPSPVDPATDPALLEAIARATHYYKNVVPRGPNTTAAQDAAFIRRYRGVKHRYGTVGHAAVGQGPNQPVYSYDSSVPRELSSGG